LDGEKKNAYKLKTKKISQLVVAETLHSCDITRFALPRNTFFTFKFHT
jgi:hypothetical protein